MFGPGTKKNIRVVRKPQVSEQFPLKNAFLETDAVAGATAAEKCRLASQAGLERQPTGLSNKSISTLLASALVLGMIFGLALACKSVPPEQTAAAPEIPAEEDPLCVPAYTQEEINLELLKIRRLENRRDYPSDAAYANFREIKTTGIRPGVLFRSSHPAMPGTMPPYAARLSEQAKIFTIVSLLDTRAEMVRYASAVPWYQSYLNRDAITALYSGKDFFEPYFADKLKTGIQYMLLRRGPYLIHCDDGIEATGFVALVLEALMGASPEEIIEDYMQSYFNYYGFSENGVKIISWIPQDLLCGLNKGRVVTAENASRAAERYLREFAGLDDSTIAELKRILAAN